MKNVCSLIPNFKRSPFEVRHHRFNNQDTIFSKYLVQWFFLGSNKEKDFLKEAQETYGPLGVTTTTNEYINVVENDILPALSSKVQMLIPNDSELGYERVDFKLTNKKAKSKFIADVRKIVDRIAIGYYDKQLVNSPLRKGSARFAVQISLYVFRPGNLVLEDLYSEELKAYHNNNLDLSFELTADLFSSKIGFIDNDPDEAKDEFRLLETVYYGKN